MATVVERSVCVCVCVNERWKGGNGNLWAFLGSEAENL